MIIETNLRRTAGAVLAAAAVIAGPSYARDFAFVREPAPELEKPGALANAWGDYDGDGWLDLAVGFKDGQVILMRNLGGRFVSGPILDAGGPDARALAWGDYDGDGRLDLYVGTSANPRHRNRLFRNEGAGRFAEVGQELGVAPPEASTRQVAWIDFDNDGDLDLFVAQRAGANQLFRNDGGRFVDIAPSLGLADPRKSVGACWFDFDQDGDLDLFVANQAGDRDGFFRNDGERFVDVAEELGLTPLDRPATEGSVGCAVADYDNDGRLDLFVAAYGPNRLHRNRGDGTFEEVAGGAGIVGDEHHVAGAFADIDHDGWQDLYVTTFRTPDPALADLLYRNLGGRFDSALPEALAAPGADHGVQWADFDGDGALDLALTHNDNQVGGARIYRNVSSGARERRSLRIAPLDASGRSLAPGAEVRVFGADGRLLGARIVDTGGGYNSQSASPVHLAVGDASAVTVEATYLTAAGRRVVRRTIDPQEFAGSVLQIRAPAP
ncbi:MAG: CRTAC1 family protein [Phenylobacterium sp.]|uniref:CRTAC1 family protein n=1 Tax=Phenylobacterium sp. TaxID=1871053 RepID=UPI00391D239D